MRIFSCSPVASTIFGINNVPPSPMYFGSWGVANLAPNTLYGATSMFLYESLNSPNNPNAVYISDSVSTIEALIKDYDTNGSVPVTVVTVNGAVPVNTTQYLDIQNIIYFYYNGTNTVMLYWDSVNYIPSNYIISGTASALQTAINAIAGGDNIGYPNLYTHASGIVAHAGGNQQTSGASLLNNEINVIGTVATALDSVTIGAAAVVGQSITIINATNTTAKIFPFTSGTINGGATNAGINILAGQTVTLKATSATNWDTNVSLLTQNIISGVAYGTTNVLTPQQSGSLCIFGLVAGSKFILPAATAANTGVWFEFYTEATATSNAQEVVAASSSDLFVVGSAILQIKEATPTLSMVSPDGSTEYVIKGNGSTTGGIIGDRYKIICKGLNAWEVWGTMSGTGTVATMFTATP